jgi:uncharacterized protein YndB with AHSA1/START domain
MSHSGKLQVATPNDREIVFTREFDAPRTLVFDAFTKPDLVQRWLLGPPGWTMPVCEMDLKVGGNIRYVWRNKDGSEFGMRGIFHEIARPHRLVNSEIFDEDWTGGETLVTNVFEERNDRTTVTLTVLYSSSEARDGALGTGMTDGMAAGYDRLDELFRFSTTTTTEARHV